MRPQDHDPEGRRRPRPATGARRVPPPRAPGAGVRRRPSRWPTRATSTWSRRRGVPYVGTFVDPSGRDLPNVVPAHAEERGPHRAVRLLPAEVPGREEGRRSSTPTSAACGPTPPSSREPLKKVGLRDRLRLRRAGHRPGLHRRGHQHAAARGREVVYLFAFEVNMHVRLARNMRQQNFEPPLKISNIGYNSKLIELLGDVANGWTNHIDLPADAQRGRAGPQPGARASSSRGTTGSTPARQIDLFPVTGWANAALFVEALRAIGPDVTRGRLLGQPGRHQDRPTAAASVRRSTRAPGRPRAASSSCGSRTGSGCGSTRARATSASSARRSATARCRNVDRSLDRRGARRSALEVAHQLGGDVDVLLDHLVDHAAWSSGAGSCGSRSGPPASPRAPEAGSRPSSGWRRR